jgi:hypothetical protein
MTNGSNADQPVERQELTTWAVMPGGHHIRLDLSTPDGKPGSIVVSFDTLSSLIMTLPRMLQEALNARCSDGSLRVVQALDSWRIEQARGDLSMILRLSTADGFEVAFALNGRDADSLGAALIATSGTPGGPPTTRPH